MINVPKRSASLITVLLFACSLAKSQESTIDYTECIKKSSSSWGSKCSQCSNYENTYRVNLINICNDTVEVKVAVREKSNRWRIFFNKQLAPNDSISGYACDGLGKYMFWARKLCDNSIVMPTDDEVQKLSPQ